MIDFDDQTWLDQGFETAVGTSEECKAAVYAFFSREDGVVRSSPSVHERDAGLVVIYERWSYMGVYMQTRVAVFDTEDGTMYSDGPLDPNERWMFIQASRDFSPPVIVHFDSKPEALAHIDSLPFRPDTIALMKKQLDAVGQYHVPSSDYFYLQQVDSR